MNTTQTSADTVEALREALGKCGKHLASFPWRVIPSDGKPIIAGARSGNLFRGYIATWDEADLIVAAVNALPSLLDDLTTLTRKLDEWRERAGEIKERCAQVAEAVRDRPLTGPEHNVWDRAERATAKRIAATIRTI